MKRVKVSTVGIGSKAEFLRAVDEISEMQLELEARDAEHNRVMAELTEDYKSQKKEVQEVMAGKLRLVEFYALANRDELLGEVQTCETAKGLFGFRRSPGVLKTLNSKWTMGKCLEALKQAGMLVCIKVTETLDKPAIKKHVPEPELTKYGLRMDYPEEFWVEPKRAEETEKKLKA